MKKDAAAHEGFVIHSKKMRESEAWKALGTVDWRVLQRLELEHMEHGGAENGKLIVTYGQFQSIGIRRQSISLALRRLAHLGFLRVTREGYRTEKGQHVPSTYFLTYLYNKSPKFNGAPTHDWQLIKSADDASAALEAAAAATTLGSNRSGRGKPRKKAGTEKAA